MDGSARARTLENLQSAFESERNAEVRYGVFASRAVEEGFLRISAMFRAVARAEQIHAVNFGEVIARMGAKPQAEICRLVPGTTADNLIAAKLCEEDELDVMYPNFVSQAEASGQAAAFRTFRLAGRAEATHAILFAEALKNLELQRVAAVFYVCPLCGGVTDHENLRCCDTCNAPAKKFEAVRL